MTLAAARNIALLAVVLSFPLAAGRDSVPTGDSALVEIDGVRLTVADLEKQKPGALFQARNAFYEAHKRAVDEFIDDYLLERQARRENLTVSALLERHVNAAAGKDPSEESLRVYYEGLDTKESFETVRDKIVEVIRQRRMAKARSEYLKSLRAQANVAVVLDGPRAPISLQNAPVRGLRNAPVVLVEYADYECPYCLKVQPMLAKLKAEYRDRLAIAYKDAPLPMHPRAQKASEAARCAGVQEKYWEYHDWLYQAQQLDQPDLKAYARTLQLDGNAFDRCLDSGSEAAAVKADLLEAQALGVPGTPAFFVNGRLLNPTAPVTYEALQQMVEEELRAVRTTRASGSGETRSATARQ